MESRAVLSKVTDCHARTGMWKKPEGWEREREWRNGTGSARKELKNAFVHNKGNLIIIVSLLIAIYKYGLSGATMTISASTVMFSRRLRNSYKFIMRTTTRHQLNVSVGSDGPEFMRLVQIWSKSLGAELFFGRTNDDAAMSREGGWGSE